MEIFLYRLQCHKTVIIFLKLNFHVSFLSKRRLTVSTDDIDIVYHTIKTIK